ncbi:hypothetical protein NFC81_03460 [Salinispirillum sp. LH 10-3-1]|uniref:DUF5666 domain-containing protein n=1 Tax=Salinispirillum sp. LH 10-3-1 TaxID=2952525 RepID=A0AB38YIF9_9GAMM
MNRLLQAIALCCVLILSVVAQSQESTDSFWTATVYRVDLANGYVVMDDTVYYLAPRVNYNGNMIPGTAVLSQLRSGMTVRIEAEFVAGQNRILALQTRF